MEQGLLSRGPDTLPGRAETLASPGLCNCSPLFTSGFYFSEKRTHSFHQTLRGLCEPERLKPPVRGGPCRGDRQAQQTGRLRRGICWGRAAPSRTVPAEGLVAPAAAPLLLGQLFGASLSSLRPGGVSSRGCSLQEQPGQMVPLWAPLPPPTRLSGKWLWQGPTRASSWRKLKASAGIGSPEDGAKLPQGRGWGEGKSGWKAACPAWCPG